MLSIASGSRARIETANSHRAPDLEAIESMAAMLRSTGVRARASYDAMKDASEPIDLLLSLSREGPATLGAQIEDQVRRAVRRGTLKPGARVPSMRDLARQLGVSRKVVADAYSQLAAEGYLTLRQGARPHVSRTVTGRAAPAVEAVPPAPRARFDFRPSTPDVSTFPRASWLRSMRVALATMTDDDLGYGDPRGVAVLRTALADNLGRVRGVAAAPEQIVVTSGFWQGLGLVCRALATTGVRRIAFEDPSHPEPRSIAAQPASRWCGSRSMTAASASTRSRAQAPWCSRRRTRIPPGPSSRVSDGRRSSPGCAQAARSRSRTTTTPSTATTARPSARSRASSRTT